MACNSCGKKHNKKVELKNPELYKVFGNYKYLTDRQIKARLENYKNRYCKECESKEGCDITMFFKCKGIKKE